MGLMWYLYLSEPPFSHLKQAVFPFGFPELQPPPQALDIVALKVTVNVNGHLLDNAEKSAINLTCPFVPQSAMTSNAPNVIAFGVTPLAV